MKTYVKIHVEIATQNGSVVPAQSAMRFGRIGIALYLFV
jgi:hypothetical protein